VGAPPSGMAAASVRSLVKGVVTSLLVRSGRSRWCEMVVAHQGAAEAFLRVFPKARFVCLHRSCPDVIYSTLQANPWGLSGPAFAPFVTAHPDSALTALAAYWVAHAGPLLAFEEAHPESCLRVRYEDLATEPDRVKRDLHEFLGPEEGTALPSLPGGDDPALPFTGPMAPGCGAELPVGLLPSALLAQVNDLQGKLGHPPLDRFSED
jgi:Sulfotransferase family